MSESLLENLDRKLNDINSLHYRYALARALYRGQERLLDQPRRPSLPSELVLYIFRLCGLDRCHFCPAPSLPRFEKTILRGKEWPVITVSAWGATPKDKLWCATPPLSAQCLNQINTFRLRTLSGGRHLFRVDPKGESCSWFEIGILRRRATSEAPAPFPGEVKRTKAKIGSDAWLLTREDSDGEAELNPLTGKPLRWRSHNNKYSHPEFKLNIGDGIGREHEIWEHLRPGDRLGVWMNAKFIVRSCSGKHAEIEVWERWEPNWM
ncbi:hypothetical protein FRB95_005716 [Tulasnella sp. JGI-2019a]|nr:hypothetical protein FRB95_005716 [Tulasnella sp. JGI-2019a]